MMWSFQVAKWRDDTCALCEFVMSEAFGALNDTSDRRMIKNLLESACYRWEGNLLTFKCKQSFKLQLL